MLSHKRIMTCLTTVRLRLERIGRALASLRIGRQLGLVMTGASLRICLVKQMLWRRRVVDVTSVPLDPQETAPWQQRIDATISALEAYLNERRLPRLPLNIGLIGDDIVFRRMYLPRMSGKELATAIVWEGQKLFPFDLDRCLVYHEIVDIRDQGDYEQIGVNLVAVTGEVIETFHDRMEATGFSIGHIDFLPAVMAQTVLTSDSRDDGATRLLLLLDDDQSVALFMRNGSLEFSQQFVTSVISDDGGRMMNAAAMAAELTTFLDLFNGQQFGNTVDELILAGKYAADPDAADLFAENIGLPCRRFSEGKPLPAPLRSLDEGRAEAMLDVVATGLADISRQPLLPDVKRRKIERKGTILRLATVALFVLMIIGHFHAQSMIQNGRLRTDLDSAQADAQNYENSAAYQAYLSLMSELTRRQTQQAASQSRPPSHFHLLLKELSRTIPDDISLTDVTFSEQNGKNILRLQGNVKLSGFSPEIVLAQYIEALNKSPFFENVNVVRHLKKNESGRFDLSFMLEMGARV